jgi:hypothetical protein
VRPRIQLWHGTADMTINYNNMGEAIKEWTNVLGLSATPTTMDTPMSGYTRELWDDACGLPVVEAWTQMGGGHTTPVDANAVIHYFALDKTGPDPGAAGCAEGAKGCHCRMALGDERSGGTLLVSIGALLGILLRRRRRPHA